MEKSTFTNYLLNSLLTISLLLAAPVLHAQKIIQSDIQSAGFRFSANAKTSKPIVHYQRDIQMLANVDDRLSLSIFGDGRVLVHYPVYMKRAGDYEMQLGDAELAALLRSFSSNGLMSFDEKKIKARKKLLNKSLRSKGQFHAISDGVITSIAFEFDEYQKDKFSQKIQNFRKQVKWNNLEHDARRFKSMAGITKANKSASDLTGLMKDKRLVRKGSR